MIIQHNIPALNSYRNYNSNVSALAKNLEKLSSGYRINSAGDDAAGLAISEKMRAQITGLDAAQKNVKDGTNLVKTAEGALQEVQDMMNRMVYLATQSANGTYDNEVDRMNLQKEVDALKSEIDRIADSANFNGQKLLDGTLEGDTTQYITKTSAATDETILGTAVAATTTSNLAGTQTILHKDAVDSSLTTFEVKMENIKFTASTAAASTVTLTVGTATVTASIGTGSEATGAQLADSLAKNYKDTGVEIGGVKYDVKADGDKLVFTMNEDAAKSITKTASYAGNFTATFTYDATAASSGSINLASQVIKQGAPDLGEVLANTRQNAAFTNAELTDGFGLKVGDETYVFALSDETAEAKYGEGFKVVDLRDLADPTAATPTLKGDAETLGEALTRLSVVAKDNEMFSVGVNTDKQLTFQEKASYDGDAELSTFDGIQKQIQTYSKVYVQEKTSKGAGDALTLQIGDTSDSYNQLKVSVQDMHVKSLGIGDVDISTQAGAQAAIDKIKAAINTVSSTRGDLGALQNRLDHTANNLAITEENITNAESNIRDTDIAEEMMAYTKNNILVQSAQAMLAQANMLPQGVLQLLG